jgi:hypothetical protein
VENEMISVREFAAQHGKRKQTIFKVLKRLGIEPKKERCSNRKNQIVAYITEADCRIVLGELYAKQIDGALTSASLNGIDPTNETGQFYLVQLEPEFDPGRFKVGFASNVPERLRHLRCSAPFSKLIQSWLCKRSWEKTAIDSVSVECERLSSEVYRALSLDVVVSRCKRFFELMPNLSRNSTESNDFETLQIPTV